MRLKIFTYIFLFSVLMFNIAYSETFDEIYQKQTSINSVLKDYTCTVNVKGQVETVILPIKFELMGKYYFKAPDKFKVEFKDMGNLLKDLPNVFAWNLPNPKQYNCRVMAEEVKMGVPCYVLELVPKESIGNLEKHLIWVSKDDYTTPVQEFFYKSGGHVLVNVKYKVIEGFKVYDMFDGSLEFPTSSIKAQVQVFYTDYSINKGLEDSIFNK